MKTMKPWIVGYSDFRRYLYRALHHCRRDRVIYFAYRKRWLALVPFADWEQKLRAANLVFHRGGAKHVSLGKLPSLRSGDRMRWRRHRPR